MARSLAAVVEDYRRRPLAFLAVPATLIAPFAFVALVPVVTGLGEVLIPGGMLALALVAQVARLVSAPATGVVRALLDGEQPRSALASAGRRAPERVTAAAVERLVVVPVTIVVGSAILLVALAAATAGGAALSAAGVQAPQGGLEVITFGVLGLFTVGAGVGAVFRLGSEVADVPIPRQPAASLAVARSSPRTVARLVGLRTAPWVMVLLIAVVGLLIDAVSLPSPVVLSLLFIGTVAATALAVGLERRVTREWTGQVPSLRSSLPSRRTVAAVALVLLAVTVPTLGARVADTRPSPATAAPVDDADAATIAANANAALRRVDHFGAKSIRMYNDSTGRMEPGVHFDVGVEPSEGQFRLHADGPGSIPPNLDDVYYTDGAIAMERESLGAGPLQGLFVRDAGNWTVLVFPVLGVSDYDRIDLSSTLESNGADVEPQDWRVLSRNERTVTIGVEDSERLASVFGLPAANISADSYVRLVVDADTGRPEQLSLHRNVTTAEGRRQRRVVVHYRDWGSHDVERPAAIGDPGPVELFWDALAY